MLMHLLSLGDAYRLDGFLCGMCFGCQELWLEVLFLGAQWQYVYIYIAGIYIYVCARV